MALMFLNGGGDARGSRAPAHRGRPAGQLSFGMILREEEHRRGGHKDITGYGGWRAYRVTLSGPVDA